jgi:hypothetical protein
MLTVKALATVSDTVVLLMAVPLVPTIVKVELAAGVLAAVVSVMVVVPDPPVMVAGLKLAVAPVGSPLTLGVIVPVNPLTAAKVTL